MKVARQAARQKPIIAVKSGRTASGSKAVSSHTGSLAGSDAAYDAAFKQSGVLRAESVQELFDYSTAFAYQPLLKGNRIAIVTNAGGPGVMATDALERNRLVLATLTARDRGGPQGAAARRPTFITPWTCWAMRARIAMPRLWRLVLKDPGVDGVVVILTPQTSTDIAGTAQALVDAAGSTTSRSWAAGWARRKLARGIGLLAHEPRAQLSLPRARGGGFWGDVSLLLLGASSPRSRSRPLTSTRPLWPSSVQAIRARKVATPSAMPRRKTSSKPTASPRRAPAWPLQPKRPWPIARRSAIRW